MRKSLLLFSSILVFSAGLVSCGDTDPFVVTYRTAADDLHYINFDQLNAKIGDADINESFVLLVYDSDSPGCTCWLNFKNYLQDTYIPATHNLFYVTNTGELIKGGNTFGININAHQPSICLFNHRKLVKQFDYQNHTSLFLRDSKDFTDMMNKYTIQQDKLYLYDKYESVYDSVKGLQNKGNAIFYAFKTSCDDCKAATTKVLFPYLNTKATLNHKIYMLDIDPYRNLPNYQTVKDTLKLSSVGNADYGYNTGYVPTFQYLEDGTIKNASVFYNDTISKDPGAEIYTVSDSFYTNERQSKLSYLDNVTTKVLKGLNIDSQYIDEYQGYYFWNPDNAILYHKPLLEAFLNKYVN